LARTVGSSGEKTTAAIRRAGLKLIHECGYEAMSLRQLAAEVGIQPGSLYNYIRTKQDLLLDLILVHMTDLLAAIDGALAGIDDPTDRLRAFVDFHVRYHVSRRREVFICYSELRSLEHDNYRTVVGLRRRYERHLVDILEAGVASGAFSIPDVKVAAYALLGMLSGICTWYAPGGRLGEAELSAVFTELVLKTVRGGGPLPALASPHLPVPRLERAAKSAGKL
jgi:AcrR family transcriptional regulator